MQCLILYAVRICIQWILTAYRAAGRRSAQLRLPEVAPTRHHPRVRDEWRTEETRSGMRIDRAGRPGQMRHEQARTSGAVPDERARAGVRGLARARGPVAGGLLLLATAILLTGCRAPAATPSPTPLPLKLWIHICLQDRHGPAV